VLAVVAYGEILPPAVLSLPRLVPVNVHFSLLPELRGAAPVQRAILLGQPVTGVTTMRMDEGLDTGPILLRESVAIGQDEDAGSLGDRLARLGGALLVETLDRLSENRLAEAAQDGAEATYAPKPTPAERVIDWTRSGAEVLRTVRAFAPAPGAITRSRGRNLKVLRAEPFPFGWTGSPPPKEPGAILTLYRDLVVGTGDGAVRLLEVAPEGRKHMTGEEFVRGSRPEPSERLG
jgi:methionyl-tRNA formyltransferase